MPIEELAVGIFGSIFRVCAWLVMEVFIQTICWGIGWGALKLFSLGAYPKSDTKLGHIMAVGIMVLLIPVVGLAIYA
jgi:hypothetical protein